MKNHVLRPLWVVLGLVAVLLVFRYFYVPGDFGIHERGFTYGLYRTGTIEDWKSVTVKYQGRDSCKPCHQDVFDGMAKYPHMVIQCENCHGPALRHPTDPPKLAIDKTRALCLRCHAKLQYPTSGRAGITGIDPQAHNTGFGCPKCHDPHRPTVQFLRYSVDDWKKITYRGREYCRSCHQNRFDEEGSYPHPHATIQCENCHGPAMKHPTDPPRLPIDTKRELCLACHTRLPYSSTAYAGVKGVDPAGHNPGVECVNCHNPHRSALQLLNWTTVRSFGGS
ncbi:MAG: cytochrome c3 family protein [Thermoleophilia bacterium]